MTDPAVHAARHGVAVLSGAWGGGSEAAFAVRVLAGAASRLGPVAVLVPGPQERTADGAFDPRGVGDPMGDPVGDGVADGVAGGRWPRTARPVADETPAPRAVLVDGGDAEGTALASELFPGAPILTVGSATPAADATLVLAPAPVAPSGTAPPVSPATPPPGIAVGIHVPVHALAADRPHLELGEARDYLLVLSGRNPSSSTPEHPPDDVAWLVARYPRRFLVLVESAAASVWRSRSCVRRFRVHTRIDLWRLVAHARAVVDLRPGELFARECVESVRYGVPVVVPADSAGAPLVHAGAGLSFTGLASLLGAVEALDDPQAADRMRAAGRGLDPWFGDPDALVQRMAAGLRAIER